MSKSYWNACAHLRRKLLFKSKISMCVRHLSRYEFVVHYDSYKWRSTRVNVRSREKREREERRIYLGNVVRNTQRYV